MSQRSLLELNHDVVPADDASLLRWARQLVAFLRSGAPVDLPDGAVHKWTRHHSVACPMDRIFAPDRVQTGEPPGRIPVVAAKRLAEEYQQRQVILVTWDGSKTHVVTYGRTIPECEQAAKGGNRVKRALGWPESLCNDVPARVRREERKPA